MALQLIVEHGQEQGRIYPLHEGENLVGRSSECDVVLKAADVSRKHIRIDTAATSATIHNLSRYGALLDSAPLEAFADLMGGQRISLGLSTVLLVQETDDTTDDEPEHSHTVVSHTVASAEPVPEEPEPIAAEREAIAAPASEDPSSAPSPSPDADAQASDADIDDAAPPPVVDAPPAVGTADDEDGPMSGHVDFWLHDDETQDSYDPVSVASVTSAAGDVVEKQNDYTRSSAGAAIAPPPDGPIDFDEEADGPKTRGMSEEAVAYLRRVQEKKARQRKWLLILILAALAIVAACLLGR